MADSDGDYVDDDLNLSDDEFGDHVLSDAEHDHGGAGDGVSSSRRSRHHRRRSRVDGAPDTLGPGHAAAGGGSTSNQRRRRRERERRAKGRRLAAWEDIQRSWDQVVEGADGSLAVAGLLEASKRARLLRDTTPLQRGIIRHLVLVLDMSFAMAEKDMLPTRYALMHATAKDFVKEFFEQNPISQLAVVGMRDGIAVRVSDLSGDPAEHLERLRAWEKKDPQGNPSLQNALEMCRGELFHAPSHATREVLIIFGALLSSDPGDIHNTIAALVADRIRVSVVGLSAQVAICAELCARTNSGHAVGAGPGVIDWTSSSDTDAYTVALNEAHFRDLVLATTTPPVTHQTQPAPGVAGAGAPQLSEAASLLMMGFPSRTVAETITVPAANAGKQQANAGNGKEAGKQQTTSTRTLPALSLCACHNSPIREGYGCTRCGTRVCRLPIECPACGLTLVLSTHLARSYHHLFPLRNWVEVSWAEAEEAVAGRQTIADPSAPGGRRRIPRQTACFACQVPFNKIPSEFKRGGGGTADGEQDKDKGKGKEKQHDGKRANKHQNEKQQQQPKPQQPQLAKGLSESGRYACPVCGSHFCIDCDVFAHDVIHNCPGCQADTRAHARAAALLAQQLMESGTDTGAMELDSQPPAGRENGGGGIGVNGRGSQMELD